MATTSNKGANALGYRIFCLVFCVISLIGGVVAAFVIVCASHQSADMHCPLAGFVHSLPNDNRTGSSNAEGEDTEEVTSLSSSSSNSLRTEVTLRAVFGGVTVAWVGLVVAVCVWYNAMRCRNKSRVQDTSPVSLLWARLMASADADSDDDDDATRRRPNNTVVVRGGGNERQILFERLGPDFSRWAEPAIPPARLTTPRPAATTGATTTTTATTATTQAAAATETTPPPTTATTAATFATTTTATQAATVTTTAASTSMMSAGIAGVHNPTPGRNNNTSGRVVKSPTQPVFILVGDDESSTSGDSLLYV